MISPFELRRRHARVFATLMLAGACSLLGLNVIQALHHAGHQHCEADASGDPFDCFICNFLNRLAPAPTVVFVLPQPQPGEVLATAVLLTRPAAGSERLRTARAPPRSILL